MNSGNFFVNHISANKSSIILNLLKNGRKSQIQPFARFSRKVSSYYNEGETFKDHLSYTPASREKGDRFRVNRTVRETC